MDPFAIDAVFGVIDRDLWVVTAAAGSQRGGLIATFVSQASIVPELPRVLVGLSQQHHTCELIQKSGSFALHLFSEEELGWVWRFGLQSGRQKDKLEGMALRVGKTGSPILTEALAWLECKVEAHLDTGDRTAYLAEVVDGKLERRALPLTQKRLLQSAPADKKEELAEQMAQDRTVDAKAIRAWRQRSR